MRTSKEAELNTAVLHFLAKCLTEGDYQSLADLGIDHRDADGIAQLYLSDIEHVVSVHCPLLCKGTTLASRARQQRRS